jgi:7,8-dihydropterin-6-yl-methyl-4-(beta-D-ribofuranosyl)aminobenzene 5'-phosphate synthase
MVLNEIGRRKFIKNVALGGTALLAGSGMAGLGGAATAASVRGDKEQQHKIDIGELKSLKIKCLSETGWFDTNLLMENIKASGGTDTDQYLIDWDKRNPGGYSALIEAEELDGRVHAFLFDSGWSVPYMNWVFQREGIDTLLSDKKIEFCLFSHEHLDHFWGLPALSRFDRSLNLIIPNTFTERGLNLINHCHDSDRLKKLQPGIVNIHFPGCASVLFDIPIMLGVRGETVLYFNIRDKGLVVVTGCGHPTPQVMFDFAKKNIGADSTKFYGLYGGLHISLLESWNPAAQAMLEAILNENFSVIGSNHCTGVIAVEKMIEHGQPVVRGTANFGSKSDKYVGNGDEIVFA